VLSTATCASCVTTQQNPWCHLNCHVKSAAAVADVQDYGIGAGQCCYISQEFATSAGLFAQQISSSAMHTTAHPADQCTQQHIQPISAYSSTSSRSVSAGGTAANATQQIAGSKQGRELQASCKLSVQPTGLSTSTACY
jgi:hypothetical protein